MQWREVTFADVLDWSKTRVINTTNLNEPGYPTNANYPTFVRFIDGTIVACDSRYNAPAKFWIGRPILQGTETRNVDV